MIPSIAIAHCRPGASWTLTSENLATLEWFGLGDPPTLAELESAWAEIEAAWAELHKPGPPPEPVPIVVTMGALRIALGRDLCIQVGAWIQGIQDTTQKFQAQTWWEYSPTVRSNHPVVEQFRVALNKTPEEVATYFSAAYAIDNP